jgi:hypothetical protein
MNISDVIHGLVISLEVLWTVRTSKVISGSLLIQI